MGILIDTSILVDAGTGKLDLERRLTEHEGEDIATSSVTAAELLLGVHLADAKKRFATDSLVEDFLRRFPPLPFDLLAARTHARLAAALRRKGSPTGAHDLMIAATAVARGWSVATRNPKHFVPIEGLTVLSW